VKIERLSAFSLKGKGGNPAGVVIGDSLPDDATMQRVAKEVGYSETAFAEFHGGATTVRVRYFSPEAEVDFCGHATIATAIALAEIHGPGSFRFATNAGLVPVTTRFDHDELVATLTSVAPKLAPAPDGVVDELLPMLGWTRDDISNEISPGLSYAGAWHLIIGVRSLATLGSLDYDFDGVKKLMLAHELTTLQLIHRTSATEFRSRNPFPVGGVFEDPATGAAAAALGAYLRRHGLITVPTEITVVQGVEMGRPSLIRVSIPEGADGIDVTGSACRLT
jgi:PhzF family phenazine biosynthesis protein